MILVNADKAIQLVLSEDLEVYLPLSDMVDINSELQRLRKQSSKLQSELDALTKRLSSSNVSLNVFPICWSFMCLYLSVCRVDLMVSIILLGFVVCRESSCFGCSRGSTEVQRVGGEAWYYPKKSYCIGSHGCHTCKLITWNDLDNDYNIDLCNLPPSITQSIIDYFHTNDFHYNFH